MRPPALEGGDFASALRETMRTTLEGAGLAFDFNVRGVPRTLTPEVETGVFRVAQEAVANVLKHAEANSVRTVLSYQPQSVRLVVADDGRGFAAEPDLHTYAGHWGLLGMRERASQLRGRLAVRSAPGDGTKIVLHVPSVQSR
jgi:signal transduction histidine kinase